MQNGPACEAAPNTPAQCTTRNTSPDFSHLLMCLCLHTTTGTCSLPALTAHSPQSTTPVSQKGCLLPDHSSGAPPAPASTHTSRGAPSARTPIPPTSTTQARPTTAAQHSQLGLHAHTRALAHAHSPSESTQHSSALGLQQLPATRLSLRPSFYPISCLSS